MTFFRGVFGFVGSSFLLLNFSTCRQQTDQWDSDALTAVGFRVRSRRNRPLAAGAPLAEKWFRSVSPPSGGVPDVACRGVIGCCLATFSSGRNELSSAALLPLPHPEAQAAPFHWPALWLLMERGSFADQELTHPPTKILSTSRHIRAHTSDSFAHTGQGLGLPQGTFWGRGNLFGFGAWDRDWA